MALVNILHSLLAMCVWRRKYKQPKKQTKRWMKVTSTSIYAAHCVTWFVLTEPTIMATQTSGVATNVLYHSRPPTRRRNYLESRWCVSALILSAPTAHQTANMTRKKKRQPRLEGHFLLCVPQEGCRRSVRLCDRCREWRNEEQRTKNCHRKINHDVEINRKAKAQSLRMGTQKAKKKNKKSNRLCIFNWHFNSLFRMLCKQNLHMTKRELNAVNISYFIVPLTNPLLFCRIVKTF